MVCNKDFVDAIPTVQTRLMEARRISYGDNRSMYGADSGNTGYNCRGGYWVAVVGLRILGWTSFFLRASLIGST